MNPMSILTPSSEDVRIYETCVLLPYPITQKEEATIIKEIEAVFAEASAKEVARDHWGRRGLAYTIAGHTEGTFIIFYHEMEPAKLKDADANLRLIQGIARYMIVKPPKKYEFVKYSDLHDTWQKKKTTENEAKEKEKEERLKKRMLSKQKNSNKVDKPMEKNVKAVDKKKINDDIDSLLADGDLTM